MYESFSSYISNAIGGLDSWLRAIRIRTEVRRRFCFRIGGSDSHADLTNSYGRYHFSSGDRDRLNKAEKELREFSQKWKDGKFDKGQLDDAISSIQHVLDDNKMSHEDRNAVDEDISQLRKMREAYNRHEIEGAHH